MSLLTHPGAAVGSGEGGGKTMGGGVMGVFIVGAAAQRIKNPHHGWRGAARGRAWSLSSPARPLPRSRNRRDESLGEPQQTTRNGEGRRRPVNFSPYIVPRLRKDVVRREPYRKEPARTQTTHKPANKRTRDSQTTDGESLRAGGAEGGGGIRIAETRRNSCVTETNMNRRLVP